jgi:hypothetical protein
MYASAGTGNNAIDVQSYACTEDVTTIVDNSHFYMGATTASGAAIRVGDSYADGVGALFLVNKTVIHRNGPGIEIKNDLYGGLIANNYSGIYPATLGGGTGADIVRTSSPSPTHAIEFANNVSSDASAPSAGGGQTGAEVDDYFTAQVQSSVTVGYYRSAAAASPNRLDGQGTRIQAMFPEADQPWFGLDLLGIARTENPLEAWDVGAEEFVRSQLSITPANPLPRVGLDTTAVDNIAPDTVVSFSSTPTGTRAGHPYYQSVSGDFTCTLWDRGANRWRLDIERTGSGGSNLTAVWFPYTFSSCGLPDGNCYPAINDDYLMFTAEGGQVIRAPWVADWVVRPYPGSLPLAIRSEHKSSSSDPVEAEVLAAVDWPPPRCNLLTNRGIIDEPALATVRYTESVTDGGRFEAVYARFQAADGAEASSNPPWMAAADVYKTVQMSQLWYEGLLPAQLSDEVVSMRGWATSGINDKQTEWPPNSWTITAWNLYQPYVDWLQFWGQGSEYNACDANPLFGDCNDPFPDNVGGCCPEVLGAHPRFMYTDGMSDSFLCELVTDARAASDLVGFYSRPFYSWDRGTSGCTQIVHYLDEESDLLTDYPGGPSWQSHYIGSEDPEEWNNLQWLRNWHCINRALGASGFYHDTLNLDWAQDPVWLGWLYRAGFGQINANDIFERDSIVTEYARDVIVTAHELSGSLSRSQSAYDPSYYTFDWMLSTGNWLRYPELVAYLYNYRPLIGGLLNGAHNTAGESNGYHNERKAFLLGYRVGPALSNPVHDPYIEIITTRDNPVNASAGNWFTQAPRYQGTRGLVVGGSTTSGLTISRFEDADGDTWLAVEIGDNYQNPANGTVTVQVSFSDISGCSVNINTLSRNSLVHLIRACP